MATTTNAQTIDLPVDSIVETESNEYIFGISEADVNRLAEEIGEHGFTGSIDVVDLHNGKYQVFAGHQRLRAVKKLGWTTIPCTVAGEMTESELLRKLLASNVLNRKISPLGYARAIDTYKKEVLAKEKFEGRTRDACAKFFNIGAGQVQRYEAILKATPYVQELCEKGEIPFYPLAEATTFTKEQQEELEKQIRQFQARNSELTLSANLLSGIIRSIRDEESRKEAQKRLEEAQRRLETVDTDEEPGTKPIEENTEDESLDEIPAAGSLDELDNFSDEAAIHTEEDKNSPFYGVETIHIPDGQPLFPDEPEPMVSRTPNFAGEELDLMSRKSSIAGVPIHDDPEEDDFDFADDEITSPSINASGHVTGYALVQACDTLVDLSQKDLDFAPDVDVLAALERGEAALKNIKAALKKAGKKK